MQWEILMVHCLNIQTFRIGNQDIRADLFGILWIKPFERKIAMARNLWPMAGTFWTDQVTTIFQPMALSMGKEEPMPRCRK